MCVFPYVVDKDVRLREEVTDVKKNAGKQRREEGGAGGMTGSALSEGTHPWPHTYAHTHSLASVFYFACSQQRNSESSKVGRRK